MYIETLFACIIFLSGVGITWLLLLALAWLITYTTHKDKKYDD